MKNVLKAHQLIHLEITQFKCDFNNCNKSFNQKKYLNEHKSRVHFNRGKEMHCFWPKCQYKTKEKHNCVHLNERKFKCNEENCGKKFITNQNLIRHKIIHSGEKHFVCHFNDCNKSFSEKCHLKEHMKRHLNIKSHKYNSE
ncbi:unnamed protein product, partial [Medioppia subpectinata]